MPRKPGPGRTEYNNDWNRRHPEAARRHRMEANTRHMGAIGSPERTAYNERQAVNKRLRRRAKKRAARIAARLLALAEERAQVAIRGYAGILKPNHF